MKKSTFIVTIFIYVQSCLLGQNSFDTTKQVSDFSNEHLKNLILLKSEKSAIKFVEKILFDVYGRRVIKSERPYKVANKDNYWTISGTPKKNSFGGVFQIIIDARDCRVVRITHGK